LSTFIASSFDKWLQFHDLVAELHFKPAAELIVKLRIESWVSEPFRNPLPQPATDLVQDLALDTVTEMGDFKYHHLSAQTLFAS
jgi:hypothetical protein